MTQRLRVVLGGVVVAMAVHGCARADRPQAAAGVEPPLDSTPAALAVRVDAPRPAEQDGRVEATGTFYPDDEAVISSQAVGVVTEVAVDEGARVEDGQVLVRLDATKAAIAVRQAEAALAEARARFTQAKGELARKALLLEDRTISPAAFEIFQAQHDAASAGVDAAEAGLALVEQRLNDLTIAAPFDGVIRERAIASGEYVREGERLLTLMRVDPVTLVFELPEKHAARIHEGMMVEAQVAALPGETFSGRVRTIHPVVSVDSRTVRVEARVANPNHRLMPGFFAAVVVPLRSLPASLAVPRAALTTRAGVESVLVVRTDGDGIDRVELVPVQTGVETTERLEIVSGLPADTRVVVTNVEALRPGDRVRVEP